MGKLEEFSINFESQLAVFQAGGVLQGAVVVKLNEEMKMRNIRLLIFGKGKVHWSKTTGSGNHRHTTHYRAEEIYINTIVHLFGSRDGDDSVMHPPGYHTYPFEFQLPQTLPSSFEGDYGYVRFSCQATIDKPWKFDHEVKECFTVISQLDLNNEPIELQTPMEGSEESEISCCCCISGKVTAKFRINKQAFVPGENIMLYAEVQNKSNTSVDNTRVAIKQYTEYYGRSDAIFSSGDLKPKSVSRIVAEQHHQEIPENGSDVWNENLLVPAIPPSRLVGCDIINMTYVIKFYASTNYGNDIKLTCPITIGTIPLRSAMPPQFGMAITQQPAAIGFGMPEPPGVTAIAPPPVPDYSNATAPGAYSNATAPGAYGGEVPPPAPPIGAQALPAPPSYAQCVFGQISVEEEGDSEYLRGQKTWAPVYPYYNWDQHQNASYGTSENKL